MAEAYPLGDIGDLIPALARTLPERKYNEARRSVVFSLDDVLVEVFPDKVVLTRVVENDVKELLDRIGQMLTGVVQREVQRGGDPLPGV